MKNLVKIDLFIQSLLITVGIFSAVLIPFYRSFIILLLQIQAGLGVWQLLGSLASIFLKRASGKVKQVHLVSSFLYLIVFVDCFVFGSITNLKAFPIILGFFILPWSLAIFYYFITLKVHRFTKESGHGFLPHTSF